nr:MAG TPA: HAD domain protein [Caudoviricetes sp.]
MNETKIIFLDFDGVLNRFHCETTELYRLEKDIVQIFIDTVKEVNAKIVVSSSWRRHGKEFIVNTLKKKNASELLNYFHEDSICPEDNKEAFRGNEINLWLKNHQDENIKYLILDDESDFFENQPRLQIIPDIGFSDIDALFVKAYFGIDIEKIRYFYSINSTILKIVNNRLKLADKFILQ